MAVLSAEEKGIIRSRVKCVGVPSEISVPFVNLVNKWIECSGVEWTIRRLKDIKVDFLRKKAGLPICSSWVSKKGSFDFSGPVGSLVSWGLGHRKHFRAAVSLLNIYTTFFAPGVTPSQAKKFIDGVTAPAVSLPPYLIETVRKGIQLSGLRKFRKLPSPKPLLGYNPSPSKRAPTPQGNRPELEGVLDSLMYLDSDAGCSHLLQYLEFYRPVFEGLETELDYLLRRYTKFGMGSNPLPKPGPIEVGRIGLIQEAGYKLRAVANPGRIFQCVLEPFGKELFRTLKTLPWDCTFEQSKADLAISAQLASGKNVHSVDLSGATDYFPLNLQSEVLRHLFERTPGLVNLFIEISQGEWSVPQDLRQYTGKPFLSWSKGQPLGLFPSFASFALTHGILLLGLLGDDYNGEFYILGDDVVILDDDLYSSYREALRWMGCPVSDSKTISSSKLAEFRSVIFTDDEMVPQFKWRRLSDDSFLDVVRLTPSLYQALLPRQRAVVDAVKGLPVELGGLGWNPKGLPIGVRLEPFIDWILHPHEPRERLMGYNSQVNSLLLSSKLVSLTSSYTFLRQRKEIVGALDQRAVDLVSMTLGDTFVPLYRILGKNLDLVLDGDIDIPVLGTRELSTVSRLQRWESTLGRLGLLKQGV
nr:MAG: RNA dependent RNA polymerase [Narnaviridae sp.]